MIRSMTGFGRGQAGTKEFRVRVEVRSVNNRSLRTACRLPEKLQVLEPELEKSVRASLSRGTLNVVEAARSVPVLQRGVLLVGDADILADPLVGDDLVGRLAQDAGARDGKLPHDRIELAAVADRAAEPAILREVVRRMRHHTKDICIAVLAQKLAGALIVLCGIAVFHTCHVSLAFLVVDLF